MHGNVCEYCLDSLVEDLPTGQATNPLVRVQGGLQVIRSYSFADVPEALNSTERASFSPRSSMFHFGFRVVYELLP